jgi:hypothetical protein
LFVFELEFVAEAWWHASKRENKLIKLFEIIFKWNRRHGTPTRRQFGGMAIIIQYEYIVLK